jgi:regulator of replication initiation timing
MSQQEQKGGIVFKVLTAVFAIVAIAAAVLYFNTKTELGELQVEKEAQRVELQSSLDKLMSDHNQLKAENGELSETLAEKDLEIQAKAEEIKKALAYKYSYLNVKKKLAELQEVSQGYVRQIGELKEANKQLTEENAAVKGQFAQEQQKTSELTKIKKHLTDKVNKASVLKSFKVYATGLKIKNSGKEVVTDKARRINNIKVTFGIAKNTIAKAGSKDFFVRIAQPDSKILAKGQGDEYAFNFKGEKLQYSIKKAASYANDNMIVDCYFQLGDDQKLVAGEYKVEVYEGNTVIGHANFLVK